MKIDSRGLDYQGAHSDTRMENWEGIGDVVVDSRLNVNMLCFFLTEVKKRSLRWLARCLPHDSHAVVPHSHYDIESSHV